MNFILLVQLIIFTILYTTQIYLDESLILCNNTTGKIIMLLHHLFQVYSIFGSILFGYHKQHIVIILCAIGVHIIMKQCPITHIQNKLCSFKKKILLKTYLNHLLSYYNISYHNFYYYILLSLVILYNCVYLL